GLQRKDHPALTDFPEADWNHVLEGLRKSTVFVRPAPDLDGDGVPDLVWASRDSEPAGVPFQAVSGERASVPFLLAVSGKDGSVLWCFRPPVDRPTEWRVVCPPLADDVDGDGQPDVIAVFDRVVEDNNTQLAWVRPWVEAISGRTGRSLWRYEFAT